MNRRDLILHAAILNTLARPTAAREQEGSRGELVLKDARLASRVTRREWELVPAPPNGVPLVFGPLRDPKRNELYPHRIQVFCAAPGVARPEPRFTVHTLTEEDAELAGRVARVCGALHWLGAEYLGKWPENPVDVWLSRSGQAGGEAFGESIYLFAVQEPRAPAEWLREIAHEYSHLMLPPVGRFESPEPWANGYLGERLFLKWLLQDNGREDLWGPRVQAGAFVAAQITPHRERFRELGPGSEPAARGDEEGMLFYIGQMLVLEQSHGPAYLRSVISRVETPRPQNLGLAIQAAARDGLIPFFDLLPEATIHSQSAPGPDAASYRKAAYRIYLPPGEWDLTCQGDGVPDAAMLEGIALQRRPDGGWTARQAPPLGIWSVLTLGSETGPPMRLQRIRFTRRAS